MCVCTSAYESVHLYMCVCGSQRTASGAVPWRPFTLFFVSVSHWPRAHHSVSWPMCRWSSGIANACHHIWLSLLLFFVNYIYLLCVWRMPWCAFDFQKVILSWTVWLRLVWSTQDSSLKKFSKLSWCSNCLRFVSRNHFKISPGSLCHNPILLKVSLIEPDVYLASSGLNYFFKVVQSSSLISNFLLLFWFF